MARRQGHCTTEYAWNAEYEAFVAEIGAHIIRTTTGKGSGAGTGTRGGDSVLHTSWWREHVDVANLRMLNVEPAACGMASAAGW